MDSRKGWLLPEQEKKLKSLIDLNGIVALALLPVIKLIDNFVLQRLKEKYLKNNPEALPVIYEFIDGIFAEFDN